jgi:hypothetical protein
MAAPSRLQARQTKAAEETAENLQKVLANQKRIEEKLDALAAALLPEEKPNDSKTKDKKTAGKAT